MEIEDTDIDPKHEEYILLDLDAVCGQVDIPPDEPYTLSIGEYEETVGTCFIFSEKEKKPLVHEETGSSDANLFKGGGIVDPNQGPAKQIKPVTSLQKVLRFRLLPEADKQNSPDLSLQGENPSNEN